MTAGRLHRGTHSALEEGRVLPLEQVPNMNHAARAIVTHPELSADLVELVALVETLPSEARQQVAPALGRVVDSTQRRRRILNLVQEALSQLRLDMKYLMFDLEATRRERDEYRRRLEEAE
jgi:hypothetical protein